MSDPDLEPSLTEQTAALEAALRQLMELDPLGTPSESASIVFARWLTVAGPASKRPEYFADVAENYPVRSNTNRDLLDLFVILEGYLAEAEEPVPMRMATFIGLPIASDST